MLESLRAEVSKYQGVIANIEVVIPYLNEAQSELSNSCKLHNYFLVNGKSPDDDKLKDNCIAVGAIISDFATLISEIQNKISELEKQIEAEIARLKWLEELRKKKEAGLI